MERSLVGRLWKIVCLRSAHLQIWLRLLIIEISFFNISNETTEIIFIKLGEKSSWMFPVQNCVPSKMATVTNYRNIFSNSHYFYISYWLNFNSRNIIRSFSVTFAIFWVNIRVKPNLIEIYFKIFIKLNQTWLEWTFEVLF